MTDINYDEIADAPVPVSDDELKSIADLAERQIVLEDWIENEEARLKEGKENLAKLANELLPEAMKVAGVREFKLDNGFELELSAEIKASITKKNLEWCHEWLRDGGHGDLIKNEFKVVYGKGEDEFADNLAVHLSDTGRDFNQREFVHPQSLGAFVRVEVASNEHGEEWEEKFGVFRWKQAKITRPKAKN